MKRIWKSKLEALISTDRYRFMSNLDRYEDCRCEELKEKLNRGTCENCKHCTHLSGVRMGVCKFEADNTSCCGFDFDCAHWQQAIKEGEK